MLLWSAGIATTCRMGIAYDGNEWPNISVERMAAGDTRLQIRASVVRRHRSPRR
jgi:hypothetical protein